MKLKTIKRIIAISIIVVSFLFFYTLSVPVYGWYDLNLWESTGEMCRSFFTTFLATTDSAISGKSTQQIEYSIYEITDEDEMIASDEDKVIASDFSNLDIEGKIYESKGKFLWPTPGYTRINSPFGYRIHPIYKTRRLHAGIDIGAASGSTICAAADGIVQFAGVSRNTWRKWKKGKRIWKFSYNRSSEMGIKQDMDMD